MRLVGLDLVAKHLAQCRSHAEAEALRAWVYELEHRTFTDPEQLSADFRRVDLSKPPIAIFHLTDTSIRVDTLIDFRAGVVLVTHVSEVLQHVQAATTH